MADKITDKQVSDLISLLRTDASVDAKVAQVTAIKSGIKQHNVPDTLVAPIFEALRAASSSQHAALVNAGFTALNHLLTRVSLQEPKYLLKEAPRTLPLIIEKLGDQKEKFRTLALQSLVTLYNAAPQDVERSVRNSAMAGKNPRAKEASLQWLLQMHQENGLQFRSYVPTLMELLEDADGMVRDAAKSTVIELFRNAPNAAKSDLKRQLKNFKVRPAIEQAIVKELIPTASAPTPEPEATVDAAAPPPRPNLAASLSSLSSERPITPMPESRPEPVEPIYVNTQREMETMVKEMQVFFEGKETEQNWLKREESITKLRRLMAGNAATDYHDTFLAVLRGLLDGIIKAIISLRTSLSKEGCSLVQDIAITYGPGMDPMVELLMQTFIKLSAATKKISSQLANVTIDTIIGKVTYNARIMQHVWNACQDKNVQPRLYASGWVKTILNKEAHHRNHVEHTGGLDLIEKCIKKGLLDPNPGVREKSRSTYWIFAGIWPARAEAIMNGLDATAQKLLQNDPSNPNSPKKPEGSVRPGLGLSKSTIGGGKPSLRETMMAQKKAALAAKNLPARPGSAMAHFSPARTVSSSSNLSTASTATASSVRHRGDPTGTGNTGGLSVAPVRPARRRPELAARPATAGPYSVRSHDQPSTESTSPPASVKPRPAITPKPIATSPKRTAQRPRPGHAATASESSLPTPSRATLAKPTAASPRATTTKGVQPAPPPYTASSPARPHASPAMAVPAVASISTNTPSAHSPALSKAAGTPVNPETGTPAKRSLKVYEDPFTDDQTTPRPLSVITPVLEDRPVNEDAANLTPLDGDTNGDAVFSPEKMKQNARLLDSGISKVKAQSLDVHGFRKLQSILRENKALLTSDKFDALALGLFEFLQAPLANLTPEKALDTKAQVLATIRLLLKRERDSFAPLVSRGLECLLATRAAYEARSHIVSGLELLAEELAALGDASETTLVLTRRLAATDAADTHGARELSMGLHVLRQVMDARPEWAPRDDEVAALAALAARCLEAEQSAVRMDAVQLCVALHARVGDARFWEALRGVKEDPKSLITYYIVKRQREGASTAAV